jgi:hypothetical protein
MFTTGSKTFLGMGALSLVLAAAYGWTTGGNGLGPLTVGYKGGVGDHLGYTLLLSLAVLFIFLGLVAVATRDAESTSLAELAGTEVAPTEPAPAHTAYWPAVGGFGAGLVVLGLVISNVMFVLGLFVLLAVLIEWMVLAWSDRATGDPKVNRVVRDRIMAPFEVPLAGVLIVGGTILAISRLLLTSSEHGAVVVAIVLGAAILAVGVLFATRPKLSANVIAGVLVVAALGVVTLGVVSAARGERTIEHHEEEEDEGNGNGNEPFVPPGTRHSEPTTTIAEEG